MNGERNGDTRCAVFVRVARNTLELLLLLLRRRRRSQCSGFGIRSRILFNIIAAVAKYCVSDGIQPVVEYIDG